MNVPGSEMTGQRGGIHNSVTRTVVKPTHMIGGYAQQSYGFNYYGTIGTNRDEFVIVRKMAKVDWLDRPAADQPQPLPSPPRWRPQNENPRADRDGAEPRQVHRLPHLLRHLQERVDQPRGHGIRVVQQRRDQARHRLSQGLGEPGALERRLGAQDATARSSPRSAASGACSPRSSPTPTCPRSTTTTSPSPSTTSTCRRRPRCRHLPTARPRSLITGERMEKIEWGPNWEEILGGEFAKRSADYNFEGVQKEIYGQFENTFMMYLPRLCEHCLNPACVAACPSGAIYKREEDGIVLIDQDKCRGWRMCVSGCPYKKIYYNWSSGKSEKCIFCYPRIEAGQPTVCSETCVGRIRYLGVVLYDADGIEEAASVADEKDLYEAQLDIFLDPNDPAVIAQARADGVPEAWLEAARKSPIWKMAMEWKVAFPLHPEYRTLPMVWYVPPLSPIQSAAEAGKMGIDGAMPDVRSLRIPLQLPRQPAHRRRRGAGRTRPGAHARHARLHAGQDHRRRDRRGDRQRRSASPASRSRTCTRSWRSPTTRTASSSRPRTASWARTPTTCAASAASPSATAARTAAPRRACSARRARRPRHPMEVVVMTQDAQGPLRAAVLSDGGAAGGSARDAARRSTPRRGCRRRTATALDRLLEELADRRPLRPAGALRAAVRPHALAVAAPVRARARREPRPRPGHGRPARRSTSGMGCS